MTKFCKVEEMALFGNFTEGLRNSILGNLRLQITKLPRALDWDKNKDFERSTSQ